MDTKQKSQLLLHEEHARKQKHDYSHVFRKKSLFDMVRITTIAMGVDLAISSETAFVSPILLKIGLDHAEMTMVWALPPILGLILSPFLGSLSDRCRLSMGRRRPIIILLAVFLIIGLILLPNGMRFGELLGDVPEEGNIKYSLLITILGVILLDFNAESSKIPARAYALDVSIPSDQKKVINIFSALSGLGGIAGYTFGAIDWKATGLGEVIDGNIPTVFMLVAGVFIITMIISVTSFREIPLPLIEQDELLRPPKDPSIEKEREGKVSFKSIIDMPSSIKVLCLTGLLAWMSHCSFSLYFTDFVGETVFKGSPVGTPEQSELYDAGVRYGCLGLSVFSITVSLYSIVTGKLVKLCGLKTMYSGTLLIYAVAMFLLAYEPNKIGVLAYNIPAGAAYATMLTIPFTLVASYHEKGCFKRKNGKTVPLQQKRGLGTDIAIVTSTLFIGQLITSLTLGYVVSYFENPAVVIYASSLFSLCAAISSLFILYV